MKLPNFRRIFKGDYQAEFQGLVEQLSVTINNGFEVIYEALNNKISLRDNIACTVGEFLVEVNDSGTPKNSITVKLRSSNERVEGVMVISATNTSNASTYPPGAVFVSYTPNSDFITINNIKGLTANVQYRIKVVIFN